MAADVSVAAGQSGAGADTGVSVTALPLLESNSSALKAAFIIRPFAYRCINICLHAHICVSMNTYMNILTACTKTESRDVCVHI